MVNDRYYLAYGSNLSVEQMLHRCPDAVYVGTAYINGYELLFKGSQTGSYLTIEEKKGSKVPVVVWKISAADERNLDRYEGCPNFYYKKMMKVRVRSLLTKRPGKEVDAMVYIMHEERKLGIPSGVYYSVCKEGYDRFGFSDWYLRMALERSTNEKKAKNLSRYWNREIQPIVQTVGLYGKRRNRSG